MILRRDFSFNPDVASDVGVQEAAVLDIIARWIVTNANSGRTQLRKDGRWWTFGSVKQWGEQIPFLTESQIRHSIDRLIAKDYLIRGYYNSNSYNRTSWYAMTDKTEELYIARNKAIETRKKKNGEETRIEHKPAAKTPVTLPDGVQDILDHYKTVTAFKQPARITVKLAELIADKVQEHGVDTVKAVIDRAAADSFYTTQWTTMTIIDFFSPSKKTDENGEYLDGPFDRIVADVERDQRRQAAQTQAAEKARQAADTGIRTLADAIGYLTIHGIYDPTDGYIDRDVYEQAAEKIPEDVRKEIEEKYLN